MALRVNNKLWLISDTHFGHQNIVKFQQRPTHHETIMLAEWIKYVRPQDQILHLGDVAMKGNLSRWQMILKWLPGEKFLIPGNHDGLGWDWYEEAGFQVISPFVDETGVAFTHRPISQLFPYLGLTEAEVPIEWWADDINFRDGWSQGWHTNIHGHIHGNELGSHPTHDGYDPHKTYINLCVEVHDYRPRQLGSIAPR